MTTNMKIKSFEKEIEKEILENKKNRLIDKEVEDALKRYFVYVEPRLNAFLKGNNIAANFDANENGNFEDWLFENFEEESDDMEKTIDFLETIPTFMEYCKKEKIKLRHTSYKASPYRIFMKLKMGLSYKREAFSSEETWKYYKECCHNAVVDYD